MSQSTNDLIQLANKWAQSTKGVHGEWGGVDTTNVRKLRMWSNQKMKSTTFIHNDDAKCFHVVVQATHKLIMMGCINFKDHALVKRRHVN